MNIEIIKILKNGGIGVMPTDTIYGLVGSALDKKTVERIYKTRERNLKKPLIVLISTLEDLELFGINLKSTRGVLVQIWPGKVSVILPLSKANLNKFKYIHRGVGKIAFRMPKNKVLMEILKKTGPLVAPSANIEGCPPANNIKEAKNYFGNKVDFYMQGKISKTPGVHSTIIEWKGNESEFVVVREGAVSGDRLRNKKLLK